MFQVEKIVGCRINTTTKRQQYNVKWVGYDTTENTWEPEKNLIGCKEKLQKFKKTRFACNKKEYFELQKKTDRNQKKISTYFMKQKSEDEERSHESSEERKGLKHHSLKPEIVGNKPQKKKINLPTINDLKQNHIKVLEIGLKDDQHVYLIKIDNQTKWVEHKFLYPDYARQLCQFYEKSIVYRD